MLKEVTPVINPLYMSEKLSIIRSIEADKKARLLQTFHFGDELPHFACAPLAMDRNSHDHHLPNPSVGERGREQKDDELLDCVWTTKDRLELAGKTNTAIS